MRPNFTTSGNTPSSTPNQSRPTTTHSHACAQRSTTRTSCCGQSGTPSELPSHFDIKYPKTCTDYHICPPNVTHLTIKACDVPLLSPDDSSWSHSAYCPSWDYVKTFTQKLGANRAALLSTTSLVFMPIGAGLADRRGRKAIFFFGHLLSMKSLLCNLLSSLPFFIHLDPNAYLLYASSILSSLNSGSGPTSMAMMVDLIPGDMREQGFPILALFHIPGGLIAFGIGYPLLKMHLSHYTIFWSVHRPPHHLFREPAVSSVTPRAG